MKKKVPIVYQFILHKIIQKSYEGVINIARVRFVVGSSFNLRKPIVSKLLCELKEMGLIEFVNKKQIRILYFPDYMEF